MDRLTNIGTNGEIYITDNDETRRLGQKAAAYNRLKYYEDLEMSEICRREKLCQIANNSNSKYIQSIHALINSVLNISYTLKDLYTLSINISDEKCKQNISKSIADAYTYLNQLKYFFDVPDKYITDVEDEFINTHMALSNE